MLFVTYTENALPKELLKCFGDFEIGNQVIRAVKYADDLVLLPIGHY
jgi:hypothetical protein